MINLFKKSLSILITVGVLMSGVAFAQIGSGIGFGRPTLWYLDGTELKPVDASWSIVTALATTTFSGQVKLIDGSAGTPSLSFTNDTDTGLFRSATDTLNSAIGGVDELTLTASALYPSSDAGLSLGVTNTNDWNGLNLATTTAINWENSDVTITHSDNLLVLAGGNLSVGDNNITNVGDIALDSISSDAGTDIALTPTDGVNVTLGSDAGDDFTIDTSVFVVEGDNSNVGIRTTSPGQELVVASSDIGTQISLQNEKAASATNFQDILFRQKDSGGTIGNFAMIRQDPTDVTAGSEDGQLQFQVMDGGSIASRLTIDGSNVGIGTTSPDDKLHVIGTTDGKMKLENTGNSNTNFSFKAARTGQGNDIGAFDGIWSGTDTVARVSFVTGSDTTNKDDGRIDFWTQPSGGGLSLRTRIDTDGAMLIAGTTQSNADTTFLADGGAVFNEQGNDTDFRVEASGQPNALFVQGSDGSVGIGESSPTGKLDIVVADTDNVPGLEINQNDTTNNPRAFTVNNAGVSNGIEINQTGTTGAGTAGVTVLNSSNPARGLYAYSNYGGADGSRRELVRFTADNTSFDQEVLWIQNDGTGKGLFIDQNGNGKGLVIDSEATTAGNYALEILTGQGADAAYFQGNMTLAGDLNPEADGTRDLGTQTTAQWANVWADLVNGADYGYLNGWRSLESEVYAGYPEGIAFGNDKDWPVGIAIANNPTLVSNSMPTFAVTDEFIEYKGRRITGEDLDKILTLLENPKFNELLGGLDVKPHITRANALEDLIHLVKN